MGRTWTPEDIARLSAAYKAGDSYADIAMQLGRSTSSITNAAHRFRTELGVPRNQPWTSDQDLQLVEYLGRGEDLGAVAHAMGRSPAAVAERRRTLAGPASRVPRAYTEQLDLRLVNGWRQGRTIQAIANDVGLPMHAVTARIIALRRTGTELQTRRPRWTQAEKSRLARRYREGATRQQLIAEFGRARGSVGRQLAALRANGVDLQR